MEHAQARSYDDQMCIWGGSSARLFSAPAFSDKGSLFSPFILLLITEAALSAELGRNESRPDPRPLHAIRNHLHDGNWLTEEALLKRGRGEKGAGRVLS